MDVRSRSRSCKRVLCALMVLAMLVCLSAEAAWARPLMIRDRVSGGGDRDSTSEFMQRVTLLLIMLPKGSLVPPSGPSPGIN
ncbi:ANK_REP_REGION domain-containing protein [Psidium guajava]|nr:ANK_REP_REGION domain-containing protein [Psidium guajava]